MDLSLFPTIQIIIFVALFVLLCLEKIAIKNGRFVKVEYSKPKRLFWAVLIASIVACNSVILGNFYFIVLGVAIGLYLYFFKQYYEIDRKKN